MTYDYANSDGAFLRENVKGSSYEMTYAGALSFLRRNYSRNLDGVDIAVSGIPFDGAVTNRPGCRFGPVPFAVHQRSWLRSTPFPSVSISLTRWLLSITGIARSTRTILLALLRPSATMRAAFLPLTQKC